VSAGRPTPAPTTGAPRGDAPPVRAHGLVKRYGELVAVDHVDLNVATGDIYGYLGPNGAGKTTSLRMLLGLIRPDEGAVELFGRDPLIDGARALDGVAGFVEAPRFYPYMTGRRNLDLLAAFDGGDARERIDESLRVVDLDQRAGDKVGGYSHGMRQRLGIAAALLRAPRLLLLDEPATGLDPAGLRDMRSLIRRLAGEGITVMLSSHQLAEVEELCNRVAIIRAGKIAFEGGLAELKRSAATEYRMRTTDDERAVRVSRAQPEVFDVRRMTGAAPAEDGIRLRAEESAVADLSIALAEAGVGLKLLANEQATLEDLFFRLTEGEAETDKALA
jgi:ABC-2 type transport system ATP-binding protein